MAFEATGPAANLVSVNTPPVRFAIVSPARWGRLLLDAARASRALAFAGVWSRSGENRDAVVAAYGGTAYPTLDDLLADPGVEAVVLPTPHFLHHPQAMAAFAAGKHVFVEKPIANTLDEAREMQRAAASRGLVLAVGLQGRRTGGVRKAKAMIDQGEIGRLVMAVAVQGAPIGGNYQPGDWEIDPERNPGGPLLNLGVHYMDVMQYLFGPVRRVSGFCDTPPDSNRVPDAGSINLQFESGLPGVYLTNQISVYTSRLTIYGTKGALHLNRFGQELIREEPIDIREAQRSGPKLSPVEFAGPHPYTTALQEELEDFARSIRTGAQPEVGAREGILALRPILAALDSHRSGRVIELSPDPV